MNEEPRAFQDEISGDAQQALRAVRARFLAAGPSSAARERMRAHLAQEVVSGAPRSERSGRITRWLGVFLVAGIVGWGVLRATSREASTPAASQARVTSSDRADEQSTPAPSASDAPQPATSSPPAAADSRRVKRMRAVPAAVSVGPSELAILQRARRALGTDPSESLRMVDEHRARYPRGTFAEERELLRIEALVALQRGGEARASAQRFERAYPASAHLARIAHVIGRGVE